jgi:methionyl-tRNA synthetase
VPAPGLTDDIDKALRQRTTDVIASAKAQAVACDFSGALRDVWSLISDLNKYIVTREPWVLAKQPAGRPVLDAALGNAADVLRVVAALIEPVMPATTGRIRKMLGIEAESWNALSAGRWRPAADWRRSSRSFPEWNTQWRNLET